LSKLGDVQEIATGRYMLTSIMHINTCEGLARIETWTPIPPGMDDMEMGRTIRPAQTVVTHLGLPPKEYI
jgi:hypothetical protein